ncbi:hypothetical protein [Burkholderia sp. BCC0405]|uniref:hypothetical protein n=1 Tax=Burkholderia sp. BCC0405 TaxID=2676298 RepID=UPI00158D0F40|nr:hypothetical protein [Burkholderia sp. BCC0405]
MERVTQELTTMPGHRIPTSLITGAIAHYRPILGRDAEYIIRAIEGRHKRIVELEAQVKRKGK